MNGIGNNQPTTSPSNVNSILSICIFNYYIGILCPFHTTFPIHLMPINEKGKRKIFLANRQHPHNRAAAADLLRMDGSDVCVCIKQPGTSTHRTITGCAHDI